MRRLVAVVSGVLVAVAGCAGDDSGPSGAVVSTFEIRAGEFFFVADEIPAIEAGDTVRFVVDNVGVLVHELQVLDANARTLGRTDRIPAGGRDEVVVTFTEPGIYQFICDVDDHLTLGQRALFQVSEG